MNKVLISIGLTLGAFPFIALMFILLILSIPVILLSNFVPRGDKVLDYAPVVIFYEWISRKDWVKNRFNG